MPANRGTAGIGDAAAGDPEISSNRAPARILRLKAVMEMVGLRRAALYRMKQEGTFPEPIRLGVRAVGWVEEEVLAWIAERAKRKPERPRLEAGTHLGEGTEPRPRDPSLRRSGPAQSNAIGEDEELRRLRAIVRRIRSINRLQAEIARLLNEPRSN